MFQLAGLLLGKSESLKGNWMGLDKFPSTKALIQ